MALTTDDVSSQLANKFTSSSFDPEKYGKDLAAECDTDAQLQEHRKRIQALSEETAVSLKKNVYKNYIQFIETSKEISYLEAEMYQLGHLLAEQKAILTSQQDMSLFGAQDSNSMIKPSKKDEKGSSSIESVEGLSSVLDVNDIVCVFEGDLMEMEPATFLPKMKVHAFLLHDSMVVASIIQNRRGPVRYKFLCLFELENVAVVNMASSEGLKYSFKVLLFPETHVYQADNKQLKNEWLDKIEECKTNFKLKLEQEVTQGESEESSEGTISSSTTSTNPFVAGNNPFLDSNPFANDNDDDNKDYDDKNPFKEKKSTNPFDEDEGPLASSSPESVVCNSRKVGKAWLRDLPEDLDMFIAQRDFERAMELIDRTNQYLKENSSSKAAKEIRVRLDRRVKKLVEVLIEELDCSRSFLLHVGPRATRRAVSLLVRLGRASEACDLFLRNRSEAIKYSLRQLKIEGATALYIAKLSSAFFSSIIETGKEFDQVFASNRGFSSAFVVWANSELKHFVTRFSCQVFRGEMSLAAVGVCVSMAKQQCEKLHEIGLDLTFSMQEMLERDIVTALLDTRDQMIKFARHKAKEGNWSPIDFEGQRDQLTTLCGEMESCGVDDFHNYCVGGSKVELSNSTVTFTKGVLGYLADGLNVNTPQLQQTFVNCIADLFENQVVLFEGILKSGRYSNQQDFILKNASFVLETILPLVKRRLKVGGSQNRFLKIQHELKRLQAISPSTDPSEAEGQAATS
ncbi:exocyst complex component 8-like isoform X2 [Montipora foliosa]|uniref:exocyst complex component 8-like isoform X2 n=1 Tax=Montipora foliosa TaxID=591990 RepID=UPI0035F1DF28